jgi:hypothetical protein
MSEIRKCSKCKSSKLLSYFAINVKGQYFRTCDKCRGKTGKLTISECQKCAESKGGECLSTIYINSSENMSWKCSDGHIWSTTFHRIRQGSWCLKCYHENRKLTIEECQEFAKNKGGICLSETYDGCMDKMPWKCAKNHIWRTSFDSIKSGCSWCPECQKLTIEECREYALSKNGECLSETYLNSEHKMSWKCSKSHTWNATFHSIKQGSWCPECSSNKSEKLCREIFEKLLMEPFPTQRPQWLEKLELDGYNEELNIAFEYNGKQHYEYIPHFHNNDPEKFELQQLRDIKKYSLCKKKGINLIIIPYQYSYQKPKELEDFITTELWKLS